MLDCQNTGHLNQLKAQIKAWAKALGFEQMGVADIALQAAGEKLQHWLRKGYHGSMAYMAKHGSKRYCPTELLPGTVRVIVLRMHYLHDDAIDIKALKNREQAYIAQYALGRDYHKLLRKRLQKLCTQINAVFPDHQYRAFVDSAPVMEKPLAVAAGLGWQGKHTVIINRQEGSWFFLGSIYTNLPLPTDEPAKDQCGQCRACLKICPTRAIVAPYVLNATRCIAYLTIENKGPIPLELRSLMGNRVFGCDDCQLICPWNRYAQRSACDAFQPRAQLRNQRLIDLFGWSEATFMKHTEGSAIRRAGHVGWLRNLAVGLGNAAYSDAVVQALRARLNHPHALVREHAIWALKEQHAKKLTAKEATK